MALSLGCFRGSSRELRRQALFEALGGGVDTTAPTLLSATVDETGLLLTLVFSEAVVAGADGFSTGFSITTDGDAVVATYSSGTGTTTLVYDLDATVASADTLTLDYTQPGDGIQDAAANLLASFANTPVTNNSTQTGFDLTGLEAYWKLDETGTNNRADSHGANTLTAGATMTEAAGKIGNAAEFTSQATDILSINDNASLSFGDEDMEITGWINVGAETVSSYVISKESVTTREYLIYHSNTAHKLYFFVGADSVSCDTFGALSTGTWYFFRVQHDAGANTIGISINNGAMDTASHAGGITDGTAPFRIGQDFSGASQFNGMLDEVAVWRNISDSRATALYNAGTGLTYPF